MNQTYTPGVCNIGPAEIATRKRSGWIAALVAVVLLVILLVTHISPLWRLILFLPLSAAALGFFQTYFHFCVGYGFKGVYNVLKPAGEAESVEKAEFRAADRRKANQMVMYSLLIALILTIIIYDI